jgi:hypothetical protein
MLRHEVGFEAEEVVESGGVEVDDEQEEWKRVCEKRAAAEMEREARL